jgi:hypothetical protein
MPKIFYTERDIDDFYARGITSIDVNDNVVLTDLARERMFKVGITPNRIKPNSHPGDSPQEALVHRVKAAVIARVNGQIDTVLLDALIRRILADLK